MYACLYACMHACIRVQSLKTVFSVDEYIRVYIYIDRYIWSIHIRVAYSAGQGRIEGSMGSRTRQTS